MDQAISDRIVELATKWQGQASWTFPFKAADNWRKYRDKANRDLTTANRMQQDGQLGEMLELFQHDAERFDELAEFSHKEVIAAHCELTELANLLREHAQKLLRLLPVVNFFDPQPDDVSTWLAAMREIESEILGLVAAPTNTVEPQTEAPAPVEILDRLAVLFGDSGGKMLRVVSDPDLSTEQKLWEMERIDKPLMTSIGSSEKLGSVFGVTGAAIRKTGYWIERQKCSKERP